MRRIHFISGLPRSGSTLLSAILGQNPHFYTGITSSVGSLFNVLARAMSQENETAVFLDDEDRANILGSLFSAYYASRAKDHRVVFDTNRMWCGRMSALTALFPDAKVIACVRHLPWVLDSIERLVQANPLQPSKMFGFDPSTNVYQRAEALLAHNGLIGWPWGGLREAWSGHTWEQLLVLQYETLTMAPEHALAEVYEFLGEDPFQHDFTNVAHDSFEFDARIGVPGLHRVAGPVSHRPRASILPPDLFASVEGKSFWRQPEQNTRNHRVV